MEKYNDILKELNAIAPELAKLKKKVLDDVPLDYFSSFSNSILRKIQREELKKAAPSFAELERVTELDVPSNYFKEFPLLMLEKVKQESKERTPASSTWLKVLNEWTDKIAAIIFKPKFVYAFAGTATMLIIGSMFFLQVEDVTCAPDDLTCMLEKVSDEELDSYIYSNADDFQKSVLDISSDDAKLQNKTDEIGSELNNLLNELDDESLNNISTD
jgi:hypothetical protein